MARIIYFGIDMAGATSRYRAHALARLGHDVTFADPFAAAGATLRNRWTGAVHYRTGYRLLQPRMKQWLSAYLAALPAPPDLVWVDSGELFGPECLAILRALQVPIVLYNHDDPTGPRDGRRFDSLRAALPAYDVCAVVREPNLAEMQALGARGLVSVWRSYDEVMHAPFDDPQDIPPSLRSDVAFVGTWMRGEHRDRFLAGLLDRGVPVSIWGARWEASPLWDRLRPHYRGGNLVDRDYVAVLQGAKLCIGMLSQGNRDLHTTRTMEIPYLGGLLCAQRTSEHMALFKDGVEALLWDDESECAQRCLTHLADDTARERVRLAGMARIRAAGVGNEDICARLVDIALQRDRAAA